MQGLIYFAEALRFSAVLLALFELMPAANQKIFEERLAVVSSRSATTLLVVVKSSFIAVAVSTTFMILAPLLRFMLFTDIFGEVAVVVIIFAVPALLAYLTSSRIVILAIIILVAIAVFSTGGSAFSSVTKVLAGYAAVANGLCPPCEISSPSRDAIHQSYIYIRDSLSGVFGIYPSWFGGPMLRAWTWLSDLTAGVAGWVVSLTLVIIPLTAVPLVASRAATLILAFSHWLKLRLASEKSRIPIAATCLFATGEAILFVILSYRFWFG